MGFLASLISSVLSSIILSVIAEARRIRKVRFYSDDRHVRRAIDRDIIKKLKRLPGE